MEYTRGIDSRFPVSELANKIKERGIKDKKTKKNAYQMEYSVRVSESFPPQNWFWNLIGYCRLLQTNTKKRILKKLSVVFAVTFG